MDAGQSSLFLQCRTHGSRRPAGAFRVARDLLLDFSFCDLETLSLRDLVEGHCPGDRVARGIALAFTKGIPVDVRLPRIDLLIDETMREFLDASIELALDQRRRDLEGHSRGQLLHETAPHGALRGVLRFVLKIAPDLRTQRV